MLSITGNSSIINVTVEDNKWMTSATYIFFLILSVLCLLLYYWTRNVRKQQSSSKNENFIRFQRQYFLVYFLALFGDWLQGPYVYKLYSHYGFAESQIAALYIVGFGTSMLLGTSIGTLADQFGRKRMCMAFSILYSLCCLTKLSSNYFMLMLGRFLGGISTSLLFSTFESWYICQHIQNYDFPKEWISTTFSKATFWNGVLAIIAGIVANIISENLNFGPVSPFILAIPFLLSSGVIIYKTWNENYGEKKGLSTVWSGGLTLILSNQKILLLGFIQSTFESVMYVFVFLWTPVLDPDKPPLGIVFSVFMICIMIGSLTYQLLVSHHVPSHWLLALSLSISFFSMTACTFSTDPFQPHSLISYLSFLGMEFAVGMYFPSIGFLKSQLIPESNRANIMNWFRVPLNIITCAVLLWLHSEHSIYGNRIIFAFCAVVMFLSNCTMLYFHRIMIKDVAIYGESSWSYRTV